MRLLPTVIAAAAITALTAPSAFAMEKMDGDAWLKAIFHGKPGAMIPMTMPAMPTTPAMIPMTMPAMPTMPKGKMDMSKWEHWSWPWKWPMDKK